MDRFGSQSVPLDLPAFTCRAIQRVVRHTVPRLADFCFAYVVDGITVACVASAHATREGERLARALARAHRITRSDPISSVAEAIRNARPLLRTAIHDDRIGARPVADGDVAELHRRLQPRSALTVPVAVAGAIVGAVSLCYSESGRRYTPRDIPAAVDVAREIGGLLSESVLRHGTIRLRAATRDARQGTTLRRRVGSRD